MRVMVTSKPEEYVLLKGLFANEAFGKGHPLKILIAHCVGILPSEAQKGAIPTV